MTLWRNDGHVLKITIYAERNHAFFATTCVDDILI
jgi:hypothetical protein